MLTFMEYSMLFAKYKSKTNAKLVSSMKAKVTATGNSTAKNTNASVLLIMPDAMGLNFAHLYRIQVLEG